MTDPARLRMDWRVAVLAAIVALIVAAAGAVANYITTNHQIEGASADTAKQIKGAKDLVTSQGALTRSQAATNYKNLTKENDRQFKLRQRTSAYSGVTAAYSVFKSSLTDLQLDLVGGSKALLTLNASSTSFPRLQPATVLNLDRKLLVLEAPVIGAINQARTVASCGTVDTLDQFSKGLSDASEAFDNLLQAARGQSEHAYQKKIVAVFVALSVIDDYFISFSDDVRTDLLKTPTENC